MLQAVLGLDAARIASVFVVQPAAMGQRLSRAKTKIRDAVITFEVPGPDELPSRLEAVLEAVYAAYSSGWEDVAGADPKRRGLSTEALELGRLVVELLPHEPEALGLLALMLYCEARRDARRQGGRYVPLLEQDVSLWSPAMLTQAERTLHEAARLQRPGRFQWEAAIQSAHSARLVTGETDWSTIAALYEGLVRVAPTLGAEVGRAAAIAEAIGPQVALECLQALHAPAYQPLHALTAHLLRRLGRIEEARAAYERAIGLCQDDAARDFLQTQHATLELPTCPE
jgi:RNA polymerase sigma-70 factor (ECF subfamily)